MRGGVEELRCLRRRGRCSQPQQHQHMNTQGTPAGPCTRECSHTIIGQRGVANSSPLHIQCFPHRKHKLQHTLILLPHKHHNTHLSSHAYTNLLKSRTCVATCMQIISRCIKQNAHKHSHPQNRPNAGPATQPGTHKLSQTSPCSPTHIVNLRTHAPSP